MKATAGYKETDIGTIPEDWEATQLGKHATFKTGPFGSALHRSDYVEGGVPVINPMQIVDGRIRPTPSMSITEQAAERLSEFRLAAGSVIIGRRGEMGRCALVRPEQEGWLCGTGSLLIRPRPSLHGHYLQRVLSNSSVIAAIENASVGSTMINLNQGTLANLLIPLPPTKSEQEAVAEALSNADALIESLEQLLAKKRQLKQGAMQELLTGRRRLPGFSGNWELRRLGDLAVFYKGKGLPKSELDPYGSLPCIHYGELFTQYAETICNVVSRTNSWGDSFRSVVNDVLMPTSDVTPTGLAKASCIEADGVILGGDILVIRPNSERVFGPFLSYAIRHEEMQILQLVTGTTVFHLYAADMKRFTFLVPSLAEQQAVVAVLDDMDAEVAALDAKLTKARALKQGMMQELLTGRIRLV